MQSPLEAAKQGNPEAIAALLNRSLQAKGISAKVTIKGQLLQILLESEQVPDQATLIPFIQKGITGLGIAAIEVVRVYGKSSASQMPDWNDEFSLTKVQTAPPSHQAPAKPQPKKVKLGEQDFKRLISEKGHIPGWPFGGTLNPGMVAKYLAQNSSTEGLIGITGVRCLGRDCFLILTEERLLCVAPSSSSFLPQPTQFNLLVNLPWESIGLIKLGVNGLIVKEVPIFYMDNKQGNAFADLLKSHFETQTFSKIALDTHEIGRLWGMRVGIGMAGLAALWGLGTIASSASSAAAIVACENAVKAQLRSPGTAKFPGLLEKPNAIKTHAGWQISSWVDSQNIFGATIRTQYICESNGSTATVVFP